MPCQQLESLRRQAGELHADLKLRRQRARERSANDTGSFLFRPSNDYEGFLSRRIAKVTAEIELHIIEHRCQD